MTTQQRQQGVCRLGSQAVDYTILASLSEGELQSLLIFEAWSTWLFVDIRNDRYGTNLRLSDNTEDSSWDGYTGMVPVSPLLSWKHVRLSGRLVIT